MKTAAMQTIDRYAGQLVCRVLSLVSRKNAETPKQPKHILIIKMFGMGSIVLMTPMLRALKKQNPGCTLSFVTLAENSSLPSLYGITDAVYPVRRSSIALFFLDSCRALLRLRKQGVDISVDAEFFSRYTAVFCFLVGAQYRVGFYSRDIFRGNLIDYRGYFNPYRHMVNNFLELGEGLPGTWNDVRLSYPETGPEVKLRVRQKLSDLDKGQSAPPVLINPNVSDTSTAIDRSWPLERFVAVAAHLGSRGYTPFFIGSSLQKARTEEAAVKTGGGAVSAAGLLDIGELLALMKESFLLITNDSGPLHLAVSVNLPTFSFFGTESPIMYGHRSPVHHLFFKELACSPCLSVFNFKRGKCEFGSRCLTMISAEDVVARFEELLPVLTKHYADRTGGVPAG
jgi:ADP-heptose:LPS heptosyltransferase